MTDSHGVQGPAGLPSEFETLRWQVEFWLEEARRDVSMQDELLVLFGAALDDFLQGRGMKRKQN